MDLLALWLLTRKRLLTGGHTSRETRGLGGLCPLLPPRSQVGSEPIPPPKATAPVGDSSLQRHSSFWVLTTSPLPCLVASKNSHGS